MLEEAYFTEDIVDFSGRDDISRTGVMFVSRSLLAVWTILMGVTIPTGIAAYYLAATGINPHWFPMWFPEEFTKWFG